MIKGAKTIAEYMIRRWIDQEFYDGCVHITEICGNEAEIVDNSGGTATAVYDPVTKTVEIKE